MRAQLLDAARPASVVDVVRGLNVIQRYPYADIAPSADLVLWSRIGARYEPDDLQRALEVDRSLLELDGMIRPMEDLALFLAQFALPPKYAKTREWLELNHEFRDDLLRELYDRGPVLARELPDTARYPWPSSGWTNNRNVTQMLECLMMRGEVAIASQEGGARTWDLAERVYPEGLPVIPVDQALAMRDDRRLRSLGVAPAKGPKQPLEPIDVGPAGLPATIEGSDVAWRVHPDVLPWIDDDFEGRTALLSPFDRLVYDRIRTQGIFEFDFTLEMFKPKAKRRWGYFALPILHRDRLVGKLDASADRKAAALRVNAIHEDVPFTTEMRNDVDAEITALARWLGMRVDRVGSH
ncbi:hypothetical protein GCM10011600_22820 [Pseudolysinimonas yzui]|uniref:Winged helix-turn-helix domain-containing protein n=1 Tax=Pseudolysinimonas yzui TaxID=2708254 RepID=A0A8J3M353_9MICO|nr:hypothetical protein GCM10011600_22820 [Pseudolysinimonas yzui]